MFFIPEFFLALFHVFFFAKKETKMLRNLARDAARPQLDNAADQAPQE